MDARIRELTPQDLRACGELCYRAFLEVSSTHGLPPDFASEEEARAHLMGRFAVKGTVGFVIEHRGEVAGFRVIDERSKPVAGLGPLVVGPAHAGLGLAHALIAHTREYLGGLGFTSTRLVQSAVNPRSLNLFCASGFEVREPLLFLIGKPLGATHADPAVRLATAADVDACDALCTEVHGFARGAEVQQGVKFRIASVVERGGEVVGYASGVGSSGHAIARRVEDLEALIVSARRFVGPGLLVPARSTPLVQFCLSKGFRVSKLMTLMSEGEYQEPRGAYLPSGIF